MKKKEPVKISKPKKNQSIGIDRENYNSYHIYLSLILLTFFIYGWTYSFKFSLDDELVINYLNKFDNTLDGFLLIFRKWYGVSDYRPITIASFWIQRWLFQSLEPSHSHLISILIFAILIIAIYRFIIIGRFFEDIKKLQTFAILSCVFFIVHPNHVSVVANIKSRDNLLSMLFGILASTELIKAYLNKQYWRVLLFIFFITIALLSKLDAYTFIFIPFLWLSIFRSLPYRKILIALFITLLLFSLSFYIREFFMSFLNKKEFVNATLTNAGNPIVGNETFVNKLSITFTSIYYYLKFLFVPFGYYFYFGYKQIILLPLFSYINLLGFTAILGLFFSSIYYYKKNKIYLFCFFFFLISIAYALNFFIPVSGVVMDRYNFIASLGFCMALAGFFSDFYKEKIVSILQKKSFLFVTIIYVICTFYRTSAWKDYFTLFNRDLKHLTQSIHANRLAAGTYINFAITEQESRKDYNKQYTDSMIGLAEKYLDIARKISDKNSVVWENLGICALYREKDSLALTSLRKAYQLDTSNKNAINYFGFAFWRLSQLDSAIFYFDKNIHKETSFGFAANNLINLYIRNDRKSEADSLFNVLIKIYPNDKKLQNKIYQNKNSTQ